MLVLMTEFLMWVVDTQLLTWSIKYHILCTCESIADSAALVAYLAALKKRAALDEHEQNIRRKGEHLALEAVLAASSAKLAVLQDYEVEHSLLSLHEFLL